MSGRDDRRMMSHGHHPLGNEDHHGGVNNTIACKKHEITKMVENGSDSTLPTCLLEDNDSSSGSDEFSSYIEAIAPTSTSLEHPHDKSVRFSDVEVRVFPITLGDNPACTHGPPITIEWDHVASETIPLDVWESNRRPRRRGDRLKLQWLHRRMILKEEISDIDILEANQEVSKIHRQRLMTISRLKYEKIELFTQSLFRKMKRTFTRVSSLEEKSVVISSTGSGTRRRASLGMEPNVPVQRRMLHRGNSDSVLDVGDDIDTALRTLTQQRRGSIG